MLPGEAVGEVLVVLDSKPLRHSYDVTKTTNVMVAKSVGEQELSGVQDDRVELDGFNHSRNAATTAGSDSGSSET